MQYVIEDCTNTCQSDFYKYDVNKIQNTDDRYFPMIWVVTPINTCLINYKLYADRYYDSEFTRYDWHNPNSNYFDAYLQDEVNQQVYLIEENGIKLICMKEARKIVRNSVNDSVLKYEKEFGKFTDDYKIRIKLNNITFSKLKELLKDCQVHNNTSLMDCLSRFRRCRKMSKDHTFCITYYPSDNEFTFREYINNEARLVGGIIFHGWPETGYKENFAVSLCPSYGWKIHT